MSDTSDDTEGKFLRGIGRLAWRYPGESIVLLGCLATSFWWYSDWMLAHANERERAAIEAAYRDHGIAIPDKKDPVILIQSLSKTIQKQKAAAATDCSPEPDGLTATSGANDRNQEIIFQPDSPWPTCAETIRPGTAINLAQDVFSDHETRLLDNYLLVYFESGHFEHAAFYYKPESNPIVSSAAFFFRDEPSRERVASKIREKFSHVPHNTSRSDSRTEWQALNNFKVVLDDRALALSPSVTP